MEHIEAGFKYRLHKNVFTKPNLAGIQRGEHRESSLEQRNNTGIAA
jgi:hypothetical protein